MESNLKPIGELANSLFEREGLLQQLGITSFAPYLKFIDRLCGNAHDVEEYKSFVVMSCSAGLSRDREKLEAIRKLRSSRDFVRRASGDPWESEMTTCMRRFRQMEMMEPKTLRELRNPFEIESEHLWQEEIKRFSGVSSGRNDMSPRGRVELCEAEVTAELASLGFSPARIARGTLNCRKAVSEAATVSLNVDLTNLKKPLDLTPAKMKFSRTGETVEVVPKGIPFYVFIQIDFLNAPVAPAVVALFNCFFPIEHHYRHFKNISELQTVLKIHLLMYKTIHERVQEAIIASTSSS